MIYFAFREGRMWVNICGSTGYKQKDQRGGPGDSGNVTVDDLQVIKESLWDQIRGQVQLHAKKNSKYEKGGKRRAGTKIEKETRGGQMGLRVAVVLSL